MDASLFAPFSDPLTMDIEGRTLEGLPPLSPSTNPLSAATFPEFITSPISYETPENDKLFRSPNQHVYPPLGPADVPLDPDLNLITLPQTGAPALAEGGPSSSDMHVASSQQFAPPENEMFTDKNANETPPYEDALGEQQANRSNILAPDGIEELLQQPVPMDQIFEQPDAQPPQPSEESNHTHFIQKGGNVPLVATPTPVVSNNTNYSVLFQKEAEINKFFFQTFLVRNPPICTKCEEAKPFPSQHHLNAHILKKHSKKRKRNYKRRLGIVKKENICHICNLKTKTRVNLLKHIYTTHEQEITNNCEICSAEFSSRKGCVDHMRDQHNIIPKSVRERYGDDAYEQRAKRKKSLANIERGWVIHTCSTCSYWSDTKGNLVRHIEVVHCKKAKFKCKTCEEEHNVNVFFKTKSTLQHHMFKQHPKCSAEDD